jgi:hypothetical protein
MTDHNPIHWRQIVGFLKDKEETEAMVALNRLDVGRLNEILVIFKHFLRYPEENSVPYLHIFAMSQKLIAN